MTTNTKTIDPSKALADAFNELESAVAEPTVLVNTTQEAAFEKISKTLFNPESLKAYVFHVNNVNKLDQLVASMSIHIEAVKAKAVQTTMLEVQALLRKTGTNVDLYALMDLVKPASSTVLNPEPKPNDKPRANKGKPSTSAVGVLEYMKSDGSLHRTGIRTLGRPLTQELIDCFVAMGTADPSKLEAQKALTVAPTTSELESYCKDYLKKHGVEFDRSLIYVHTPA